MNKKILSASSDGLKKVVDVYKPSTWKEKNWWWRIALIIGTLIIINSVFMFIFSQEPNTRNAQEIISEYYPLEANLNNKAQPGSAMTAANIFILDTLLNKPGGYIKNDVIPPGILMDNIPNWEYGVLRNLRDLSKIYRNNFSTSGSQTEQDKDLITVENSLSINSDKWMLPSAEKEYTKALNALKSYYIRIVDDNEYNAQFYARADNLTRFIQVTSVNLGSLSQRLASSVGSSLENTALAGDKNAKQTTTAPNQVYKKTPRLKVDNIFYEARGYSWALLQEMKAIRVDFAEVLADKKATAYVDQVIRELEATQTVVWSPIILNGSGFGFVTNHSLIMASYLSRANAILLDLSNLLEKG